MNQRSFMPLSSRPMLWSRALVTAAVVLATTRCGSCPLPNQSKTPPTVRITYCVGNPCGPLKSGNGHVDPNQPLTVFVDGFSSLSGMESLQVTPSYSFMCSNGNLGQNGDTLGTPTTVTATNQTLRLSLELDVGTPKDNWCRSSDIPFSGWSGGFSATALSKNGLSATGQLALQSP
jgi:hypothetical protein